MTFTPTSAYTSIKNINSPNLCRYVILDLWAPAVRSRNTDQHTKLDVGMQTLTSVYTHIWKCTWNGSSPLLAENHWQKFWKLILDTWEWNRKKALHLEKRFLKGNICAGVWFWTVGLMASKSRRGRFYIYMYCKTDTVEPVLCEHLNYKNTMLPQMLSQKKSRRAKSVTCH